MTSGSTIQQVKERLEQVDARIRTARDRLESGAPRDKVKAAADLAVLDQQHDALREKLDRLEAHPETAVGHMKAELEADIDKTFANIVRWMETH